MRIRRVVLPFILVASIVAAQENPPAAPPPARVENPEPNAFDEARQQAVAERKYLLVAILESGNEDSARFEKETLSDRAVREWIDARAVLLVLRRDEPIGRNFAEAHNVGEIPTALIMANDGRELGRQTGFTPAGKLLVRIDGAVQGESIREKPGDVNWAGEDVVLAAADRAAKLAAEGKSAEALAEYQWCFEHRASQSPVFPALHLSKLVNGLAALAKTYEPAMVDLRGRLEQAERDGLKPPRPNVYAFYLVKHCRTALGEEDRLVAYYDLLNQRLPDTNQVLTFARLIYGPLLKARRYDAIKQTVLDEGDVDLFIEESRKQNRDRIEVLNLLAERYEVLLGVGMNQDAKNLAEKVFNLDATPDAYVAMAEGALRSRRSTDEDVQNARKAYDLTASGSVRPVIVLAKLLAQRDPSDQQAVQLLQEAQGRFASKADQDALTLCLGEIQSKKIPPREK